MPFSLWKQEDQGDCIEGQYGNVKPPEVAPTDGGCHGSGNDGTDLVCELVLEGPNCEKP